VTAFAAVLVDAFVPKVFPQRHPAAVGRFVAPVIVFSVDLEVEGVSVVQCPPDKTIPVLSPSIADRDSTFAVVRKGIIKWVVTASKHPGKNSDKPFVIRMVRILTWEITNCRLGLAPTAALVGAYLMIDFSPTINAAGQPIQPLIRRPNKTKVQRPEISAAMNSVPAIVYAAIGSIPHRWKNVDSDCCHSDFRFSTITTYGLAKWLTAL
jgi:hypothetical protein